MAERLLTRSEVENKVTLSYSMIYRMIISGRFPRSHRPAYSKYVYWKESEIDQWIESSGRTMKLR